jgi:flagellar protein FliT
MDETGTNDVLALYSRLSALTSRMREAARAAEWDELIALEAECASVSSKLITREDGAPGTGEYQRRKADLIRKVLEDDAVIRQSVNERLAALWRLIDGRTKVERLTAAYGGDSGIPRRQGL